MVKRTSLNFVAFNIKEGIDRLDNAVEQGMIETLAREPTWPCAAWGRRGSAMTMLTGFDEAVVVDVETTGLDTETDRIVSIALIRSQFSALKDNPEGLHGETMSVTVNP